MNGPAVTTLVYKEVKISKLHVRLLGETISGVLNTATSAKKVAKADIASWLVSHAQSVSNSNLNSTYFFPH